MEATLLRQEEVATAKAGDQAGKYLTFRLAQEEYGIEILKVVEIIKMMEVTAVPQTPDFVRGVINLRGKVIPVLELRAKFGMEAVEDTNDTCIIVVNVGEVQMGIVIDAVSEVLDIKAEEIEPPPQFGSSVDTQFILGMAKAGDGVKILIDINSVLSVDEISALEAL